MPLPNTRVLHPRFEQHHRAVAEGQLTAECVITRPDGIPTALDDATGAYAYPAPTTVYPAGGIGVGRCRLQRVDPVGPREVVADRDTAMQEYMLVLPADAPQVVVNDLVTVTVSAENADLVGRVLTVTGTDTGSITWQRTLRCTLHQPAAR